MQPFYTIDLPEAARDARPGGVEIVTPSSSRTHLDHVERFARYFMREMHYDGIQFEAASDAQDSFYFTTNWQAFLFIHDDRYIGAGCFRHRPEESAESPWVFDWLWLHPYCRRRGNLSRAWGTIVNEMPNFRLQSPLSVAMQAFAEKIKWSPDRGRAT